MSSTGHSFREPSAPGSAFQLRHLFALEDEDRGQGSPWPAPQQQRRCRVLTSMVESVGRSVHQGKRTSLSLCQSQASDHSAAEQAAASRLHSEVRYCAAGPLRAPPAAAFAAGDRSSPESAPTLPQKRLDLTAEVGLATGLVAGEIRARCTYCKLSSAKPEGRLAPSGSNLSALSARERAPAAVSQSTRHISWAFLSDLGVQ